MSVRALIESRMSDITSSERRVARVLLSDYPKAGMQPIAKLAASSNVSGPTVIRLIKKLGFEGYQLFQDELLNELTQRNTSFLELYDKRKTGLRDHKLLDHLTNAFQQLVSTSLINLPFFEFDSAIKLLSDPKKRVICVGGRFSDFLARYLAQHLHELRPGVRFAENAHTWRHEQLLDIDSKDIVVVFDFRRYQSDTVDFAEKASQKGATIILVTDPLLSPAASVAQCVLPVEVDGPSAFDSSLAALALIEVLVAGVIEIVGEEGRKRVKNLEDIQVPFEYRDLDE